MAEPDTFAEWRKEIASWTASAFLAGEPVEDETALKGNLYSTLCRLQAHLLAWEEESPSQGGPAE